MEENIDHSVLEMELKDKLILELQEIIKEYEVRLNSKDKNFQLQFSELQKELFEKDQDLLNLTDEKSQLELQIIDLQNSLEDTNLLLHSKDTALKIIQEDLKLQLETMKSYYVETLSIRQEEIESLRLTGHQLREQLAMRENDFIQLMQRHENQIISLFNESQTKNELSNDDKMTSMMKDQIFDIRQLLNEKQELISLTEKKLADRDDQVRNLQENIFHLTEERKKYNQTKYTDETYQNHIGQLSEEIKTSKRKQLTLKAKVKSLERQIDSLNSKTIMKENEKEDDFKNELNNREKIIDEQNIFIYELRQTERELRQSLNKSISVQEEQILKLKYWENLNQIIPNSVDYFVEKDERKSKVLTGLMKPFEIIRGNLNTLYLKFKKENIDMIQEIQKIIDQIELCQTSLGQWDMNVIHLENRVDLLTTSLVRVNNVNERISKHIRLLINDNEKYECFSKDDDQKKVDDVDVEDSDLQFLYQCDNEQLIRKILIITKDTNKHNEQLSKLEHEKVQCDLDLNKLSQMCIDQFWNVDNIFRLIKSYLPITVDNFDVEQVLCDHRDTLLSLNEVESSSSYSLTSYIEKLWSKFNEENFFLKTEIEQYISNLKLENEKINENWQSKVEEFCKMVDLYLASGVMDWKTMIEGEEKRKEIDERAKEGEVEREEQDERESLSINKLPIGKINFDLVEKTFNEVINRMEMICKKECKTRSNEIETMKDTQRKLEKELDCVVKQRDENALELELMKNQLKVICDKQINLDVDPVNMINNNESFPLKQMTNSQITDNVDSDSILEQNLIFIMEKANKTLMEVEKRIGEINSKSKGNHKNLTDELVNLRQKIESIRCEFNNGVINYFKEKEKFLKQCCKTNVVEFYEVGKTYNDAYSLTNQCLIDEHRLISLAEESQSIYKANSEELECKNNQSDNNNKSIEEISYDRSVMVKESNQCNNATITSNNLQVNQNTDIGSESFGITMNLNNDLKRMIIEKVINELNLRDEILINSCNYESGCEKMAIIMKENQEDEIIESNSTNELTELENESDWLNVHIEKKCKSMMELNKNDNNDRSLIADLNIQVLQLSKLLEKSIVIENQLRESLVRKKEESDKVLIRLLEEQRKVEDLINQKISDKLKIDNLIKELKIFMEKKNLVDQINVNEPTTPTEESEEKVFSKIHILRNKSIDLLSNGKFDEQDTVMSVEFTKQVTSLNQQLDDNDESIENQLHRHGGNDLPQLKRDGEESQENVHELCVAKMKIKKEEDEKEVEKKKENISNLAIDYFKEEEEKGQEKKEKENTTNDLNFDDLNHQLAVFKRIVQEFGINELKIKDELAKVIEDRQILKHELECASKKLESTEKKISIVVEELNSVRGNLNLSKENCIEKDKCVSDMKIEIDNLSLEINNKVERIDQLEKTCLILKAKLIKLKSQSQEKIEVLTKENQSMVKLIDENSKIDKNQLLVSKMVVDSFCQCNNCDWEENMEQTKEKSMLTSAVFGGSGENFDEKTIFHQLEHLCDQVDAKVQKVNFEMQEFLDRNERVLTNSVTKGNLSNVANAAFNAVGNDSSGVKAIESQQQPHFLVTSTKINRLEDCMMMSSAMKNLQEQNQLMKNKIVDLCTCLENEQQLNRKISMELVSRHETLSEKLNGCTTENIHLHQQLSQYKEQLKTSKRENRKLKDKMDYLQDEICQLSSAHSKLSMENSKLEEKVSTITKSNRQLSVKLEQVDNDRVQNKKLIDKFEKQNEQMKHKCDQYRNECELLQKKLVSTFNEQKSCNEDCFFATVEQNSPVFNTSLDKTIIDGTSSLIKDIEKLLSFPLENYKIKMDEISSTNLLIKSLIHDLLIRFETIVHNVEDSLNQRNRLRKTNRALMLKIEKGKLKQSQFFERMQEMEEESFALKSVVEDYRLQLIGEKENNEKLKNLLKISNESINDYQIQLNKLIQNNDKERNGNEDGLTNGSNGSSLSVTVCNQSIETTPHLTTIQLNSILVYVISKMKDTFQELQNMDFEEKNIVINFFNIFDGIIKVLIDRKCNRPSMDSMIDNEIQTDLSSHFLDDLAKEISKSLQELTSVVDCDQNYQRSSHNFCDLMENVVAFADLVGKLRSQIEKLQEDLQFEEERKNLMSEKFEQIIIELESECDCEMGKLKSANDLLKQEVMILHNVRQDQEINLQSLKSEVFELKLQLTDSLKSVTLPIKCSLESATDTGTTTTTVTMDDASSLVWINDYNDALKETLSEKEDQITGLMQQYNEACSKLKDAKLNEEAQSMEIHKLKDDNNNFCSEIKYKDNLIQSNCDLIQELKLICLEKDNRIKNLEKEFSEINFQLEQYITAVCSMQARLEASKPKLELMLHKIDNKSCNLQLLNLIDQLEKDYSDELELAEISKSNTEMKLSKAIQVIHRLKKQLKQSHIQMSKINDEVKVLKLGISSCSTPVFNNDNIKDNPHEQDNKETRTDEATQIDFRSSDTILEENAHFKGMIENLHVNNFILWQELDSYRKATDRSVRGSSLPPSSSTGNAFSSKDSDRSISPVSQLSSNSFVEVTSSANNNQMKDLQRKLHRTTQQLNQMRVERNRIHQEYTRIRQMKEDGDQKISDLSNLIDSYGGNKDSILMEKDQLMEINNRYSVEIVELQAEIDMTKVRNSILETKCKKMEWKLNNQRRKYDQLVLKLDEKDQEIDRCSDEMRRNSSAFEKERLDWLREKKELKSISRSKLQEYDIDDPRMAFSAVRNKDKDTDKFESQNDFVAENPCFMEIDHLRKQINHQKGEHKRLLNQHRDEIMKYRGELEELIDDNRQLKRKLSIFHQQHQDGKISVMVGEKLQNRGNKKPLMHIIDEVNETRDFSVSWNTNPEATPVVNNTAILAKVVLEKENLMHLLTEKENQLNEEKQRSIDYQKQINKISNRHHHQHGESAIRSDFASQTHDNDVYRSRCSFDQSIQIDFNTLLQSATDQTQLGKGSYQRFENSENSCDGSLFERLQNRSINHFTQTDENFELFIIDQYKNQCRKNAIDQLSQTCDHFTETVIRDHKKKVWQRLRIDQGVSEIDFVENRTFRSVIVGTIMENDSKTVQTDTDQLMDKLFALISIKDEEIHELNRQIVLTNQQIHTNFEQDQERKHIKQVDPKLEIVTAMQGNVDCHRSQKLINVVATEDLNTKINEQSIDPVQLIFEETNPLHVHNQFPSITTACDREQLQRKNDNFVTEICTSTKSIVDNRSVFDRRLFFGKTTETEFNYLQKVDHNNNVSNIFSCFLIEIDLILNSFGNSDNHNNDESSIDSTGITGNIQAIEEIKKLVFTYKSLIIIIDKGDIGDSKDFNDSIKESNASSSSSDGLVNLVAILRTEILHLKQSITDKNNEIGQLKCLRNVLQSELMESGQQIKDSNMEFLSLKENIQAINVEKEIFSQKLTKLYIVFQRFLNFVRMLSLDLRCLQDSTIMWNEQMSLSFPTQQEVGENIDNYNENRVGGEQDIDEQNVNFVQKSLEYELHKLLQKIYEKKDSNGEKSISDQVEFGGRNDTTKGLIYGDRNHKVDEAAYFTYHQLERQQNPSFIASIDPDALEPSFISGGDEKLSSNICAEQGQCSTSLVEISELLKKKQIENEELKNYSSTPKARFQSLVIQDYVDNVKKSHHTKVSLEADDDDVQFSDSDDQYSISHDGSTIIRMENFARNHKQKSNGILKRILAHLKYRKCVSHLKRVVSSSGRHMLTFRSQPRLNVKILLTIYIFFIHLLWLRCAFL